MLISINFTAIKTPRSILPLNTSLAMLSIWDGCTGLEIIHGLFEITEHYDEGALIGSFCVFDIDN
jgi:hypothetical protein